MGDFSIEPSDALEASLKKGYVGLHIEQGVPLLDRDLNLLHDLVIATVRSVVSRYIGNGVCTGSDGFLIEALDGDAASQNFRIAAASNAPGFYLVGGIEVGIASPTFYGEKNKDPLTTPSVDRNDLVYLDAFTTEVGADKDPSLANDRDIGFQTSVRLRPDWIVRVAEGMTELPLAPVGHVFAPLARLRRTAGNDRIVASMITDLRQSRLTMSHIEQRLALVEQLRALPFFAAPGHQFEVAHGEIGDSITLNGRNFDVNQTTVLFGNVQSDLVTPISSSQLAARVPPGLTPLGEDVPVRITVVNPVGSATSDDTFKVSAAPRFGAPDHQFTPDTGKPGDPVTLHGFNFNASGLKVAFGSGDSASPARIIGTPTNTEIVVEVLNVVPTGSVTTDVPLTVSTDAGSKPVTSDDTFRVEIIAPPPQFGGQQFNPRQGLAGASVKLIGKNFNFHPVTVTFDDKRADVGPITFEDNFDNIQVTVPTGLLDDAGTERDVFITVHTAASQPVRSSFSFRVKPSS